ncbi:hypothetical protein EV193_101350 [Herbihabitans rhizosphaerae]|uniref:Uncharacterized protein n=1 Tax=Herbihabitans rhizosphaerae TaxID=1872711 RepID=A0A4Q7L5C5_9PSEU|nr:hypothetical protein [Herbihabitans rhizosphaerae]RZS44474.1 hypothetical protein EV193_101350 [Herbihabitans rhizosphaerae]
MSTLISHADAVARYAELARLPAEFRWAWELRPLAHPYGADLWGSAVLAGGAVVVGIFIYPSHAKALRLDQRGMPEEVTGQLAAVVTWVAELLAPVVNPESGSEDFPRDSRIRHV